MNFEKITIDSRPLSIASFANHKEATFLISVLDEPDLYGRIIPEEAGEKYHKTIIGYPIVAKLLKNILGKPTDFGGHELTITKDKNGKKQSKFGTVAIGSVIDSWIEEREVDGYEGEHKCVLIKAKLWTSRFPEYFKVFDKLWEDGNISSSWELTATDVEEKDGFKIYKVFEWIGNAILGSFKTGAVPGAGVIEYAELDDIETELAEALEKDMAGLDINNEEMEEVDLAGRTKKNTPVEDTVIEEIQISESVEEVTEQIKEETVAEVIEETVVETEESIAESTEEANEETAEAEDSTEVSEVVEEIASLTENDLFRLISKACRKASDDRWGYVSYWFPEEKTVWYKEDGSNQLDFKLYTYTVENDEVKLSDPTDITLSASVAEFNTILAEKDAEIENLKTEIASKEDAVIKAGEKINALNIEVSELKPYKEAAEKAEQERIETEIAEAKEALRQTIKKTKLFTEEEMEKPEIAELIEARDEASIKTLIAERYIASFDNNEIETETASYDSTESVPVANLETEDINESPSNYMKNFLTRK